MNDDDLPTPLKHENDIITVGTNRHPFTDVILKEPVRIVANKLIIQTPLTHEICARIISRFEATQSTVTWVELQAQGIRNMPSCDPALFGKMIQVKVHGDKQFPSTSHCVQDMREHLRAISKAVYFNHSISTAQAFMTPSHMNPEYCRQPAFQKLKNINACSKLQNEDLPKLEALDMMIFDTNVTSEGFNKFLKQWIAGTRRIGRFDVVTTTWGRNDSPTKVLKGIHHTCIWNANMHYSTAIAYKDLDDILNYDIMTAYGVTNGDKKLYVAVCPADNGISSVLMVEVADFDDALKMIICNEY